VRTFSANNVHIVVCNYKRKIALVCDPRCTALNGVIVTEYQTGHWSYGRPFRKNTFLRSIQERQDERNFELENDPLCQLLLSNSMEYQQILQALEN